MNQSKLNFITTSKNSYLYQYFGITFNNTHLHVHQGIAKDSCLFCYEILTSEVY